MTAADQTDSLFGNLYIRKPTFQETITKVNAPQAYPKVTFSANASARAASELVVWYKKGKLIAFNAVELQTQSTLITPSGVPRMSENSRKTPGVEFNQTSYRYIIGIGVTMGAADFNHALVRLDEETTELVSDDHEDCSYKGLKEQHIMRLLVNGRPTY